MKSLQWDQQLYVWHVIDSLSRDGAKRLALIVSTHVDDLKGAGKDSYRVRLIEALEAKFDKLEVELRTFECIGVMHEQDPTTKAIWAHQQHYVPQLNTIPVTSKTFVRDEEPAESSAY